MIKKLHSLDFSYEIKKDDFIRHNGEYWIVDDTNLNFFRGNGVLLTNDIPIPRLKELETQWLDEDYTDELEWLDRGIFIYTKLLESEADNDSYKYSLGRLLFENAINMKRNESTRTRAKGLFEEVIRLNPNHPKAHLCEYQLGFLNLYETEWKKAINHFESALECGELDYFQQLRAYCNLGICYSQMGEFEMAEQCIVKAKEIDQKKNRFTPEIQMASLQIQTVINENKPYMVLTEETAFRISEDEAEEISLTHDDEGYVVLDCRGKNAIFRGPEDSVKLPPNSSELLMMLMTNKSPLSRVEISEEMNSASFGLKSVNVQAVGNSIRRLRKEIKPCFDEQEEWVIKTVGLPNKKQGYQWCASYPYQIIIPFHKHSFHLNK